MRIPAAAAAGMIGAGPAPAEPERGSTIAAIPTATTCPILPAAPAFETKKERPLAAKLFAQIERAAPTEGGSTRLGTTVAQLVAEATGRIENLTPDQVAAELTRDGTTLVDSREPGERAKRGCVHFALIPSLSVGERTTSRPLGDRRPAAGSASNGDDG